MRLAHWAQHQSRAVIFVLTILAILGGFSLTELPVLLFPRVDFPRVRVGLDAGDRPAERMMIEVTRPVEEALRGIPGVRNIRSVTSRGSADVSVDFDWGRDMSIAALQINAQIGRILSTLPSGTNFDVRRMQPTVYPVIAYALTSNSRSLVDLRNMALYKLRPALATVQGVANVGVQGGDIEEWRVAVDQGKLRSFGLTLNGVAKALSGSNVLTAVGHLQQNDKLYLIVSDTSFKSIEQIKQSIVRAGPDGVVRLEDIGQVRRDTKPRYLRVTADGRQAVLFSIYQQPGGNTVAIAKAIKAKLKEVKKRIPELQGGAVKISNWYDQSNLILRSEGSVRDAIGVGVLLAAVVLFLFLRSWKITLIASLAVPIVLAVTVQLLSVLNMSLNIMTLGGMAAAVGLIVDDAIVMVEHIMRRFRGGEGGHRDRVIHATSQLTKPLVGSSSSTIIIFAPLAFLSGVTGEFFKALSITMAASLFISFLVAWLAVPILSAQFLGKKESETGKGNKHGHKLGKAYGRAMQFLFARSWIAILIIAPILGIGWFAFGHVKSGFMPSMDEGGFVIDYRAPPGTSLEETDRELSQVEAILQSTPAVETYSRRTGLQLGGGVTEANQGDFFVRLKPFPRPPISQIMSDIRTKIEHKIPAMQVELLQLMEDLVGDLTGVPEPIDIKLFGPDENTLLNIAPKIAQAVRQVNGVVEVKNGVVVAGAALDIQVDRDNAALEGVDPKAITEELNNYLSGKVTTKVLKGQQLIGVRVWVDPTTRMTIRDIKKLQLQAPDGHFFPVERVADINVITGQPEIDREDLKRMVAVTGRIEGRDLGSTMADVKKTLSKPGLLPKEVTYQLGGTYQQQQKSFQGLLKVMVAAFILIFTLLLVLYRRFLVALAMISIVLVEIAWIFIALWITGTELDIMSIMGMTMIVGIVTEVSIFYYSEYLELPEDDDAQDRLIMSGIRRARAITMTTIAAILALAMLALGIGQGAAMLQPLAIAIIAGLFMQMPLVLFILPALLVLYRGAR